MIELSIVIPAYNEEKRLPSTLESVHSYLMNRGGSFEILVVDDGSADQTREVVTEFAKSHAGVHLLTYAQNQGKGYAVRTGVLAALGQKVLFNDADGSSPIEEVEKLEEAFAQGFDVAIGSRAKADESRKVETVFYRKFMGNSFNFLVQNLLLKGLQDTQCGFKMFKRNVAQEVFSVSHVNGFAFDVEILHIATKNGAKVAEIPINWKNVDGSKVNLVLDSSKMFLEVLKISLQSALGGYKTSKHLGAVAKRSLSKTVTE